MLAIYIMQSYAIQMVFNSTTTSDLKWKNSSVCLCKHVIYHSLKCWKSLKVLELEFGKGVRTLYFPYKWSTKSSFMWF